MPKNTFIKLNETKKKELRDAFLEEFSVHTFDNASLTGVVKKLGIAKGSIYQYFEDKLDLFNYLIETSTQIKLKYFTDLKREDYSNYWEYFRVIFKEGVKFDLENPKESHFLHNLVNSLNSPSVKNLYDSLLKQSLMGFEAMVQKEIDLGLFRNDIPLKSMSFLLYKSGVAIQEQMQIVGHINPEESLKNNKPVYDGKVDILMQTVDEYIELLKKSFNK